MSAVLGFLVICIYLLLGAWLQSLKDKKTSRNFMEDYRRFHDCTNEGKMWEIQCYYNSVPHKIQAELYGYLKYYILEETLLSTIDPTKTQRMSYAYFSKIMQQNYEYRFEGIPYKYVALMYQYILLEFPTSKDYFHYLDGSDALKKMVRYPLD